MANAGKNFEEQFRDSIPKDMYWERLKDPSSSFNINQGNGLRFSMNNPYDIFLYERENKNLICLELKSTSGTSISYSLEEKKKMIKPHQIKGLKRAYDGGAKAGFIFNFRDKNVTYWFSIIDFLKFNEQSGKKSINENDVINYGGIVIPQELKRVKYRYDIKFLTEVVSKDER